MWKRGRWTGQERAKKRSIAIGYGKGEQVPAASDTTLLTAHDDPSVQTPAPVVQRQSDPYHKQDYGSRFPGLESGSALHISKTREAAEDHKRDVSSPFQLRGVRRAVTLGSYSQQPTRDVRRVVSVDRAQSNSKLRALNRKASLAGTIQRKPEESTPNPIKSSSDRGSRLSIQGPDWTGATLDIFQPSSTQSIRSGFIAVDITNQAPALVAQNESQPLDIAAVIDTSSVE